MVACLVALPEELLAEIASYASTSSLVNLVRACKQWKRVATSYLYHSIEFKETSEKENLRRLSCMVTHLFQSTQHARHVKRLHFGGKWTSSTKTVREVRAQLEDLHYELKRLMRRHAYALNRDLGSERTEWESVEVLISVMLQLVPNLQALSGSLPRASQVMSIQLSLQAVTNPTKQPLANLRELALVIDSNERIAWGHKILCDYPKLKSVFVYNYDATEWSPGFSHAHSAHGGQLYMDYVMSLVQQRTVLPPLFALKSNLQHLELSDARLGAHSMVHIIGTQPGLRTFAFDFRKSSVPEHPWFFNGILSVLSTCAKDLTALSIGDHSHDASPLVPPLDFSALENLNHLRISVSAFLSNKSSSASPSSAQSLTDDRMRQRFPVSLRKLVLLVYKDQEHDVLAPLQHYIDAELPIIPNLRDLEVCCHAPDAMYEALHRAAQRHDIRLRIFRKIMMFGYIYSVPFANTVEGMSQEISSIPISIVRPVSVLLVEEDLMDLEEYMPQTGVVVQVHAAQW